MSVAKDPRKAVDWEAVERDYRAGTLSSREIGAKHGCSHVAINKRAKSAGWTRDLKAKIQEKTEALVTKAVVTSQVTSGKQVSEREVVEANAAVLATVRLRHRTDIGRGQSLVQKLMAELERITDNAELFEQLGELLFAPDERGRDRLNEIYRKVISISGRISDVKGLTESLKNLVALERQAWGLDEPAKQPDDPSHLTDDELDAKINERLAAAAGGAAGVSVH